MLGLFIVSSSVLFRSSSARIWLLFQVADWCHLFFLLIYDIRQSLTRWYWCTELLLLSSQLTWHSHPACHLVLLYCFTILLNFFQFFLQKIYFISYFSFSEQIKSIFYSLLLHSSSLVCQINSNFFNCLFRSSNNLMKSWSARLCLLRISTIFMTSSIVMPPLAAWDSDMLRFSVEAHGRHRHISPPLLR